MAILETFATSDGVKYYIDEHGVIHQIDPAPYSYDSEYVSTYDSPEYKNKSLQLMGIRLGNVCAAYGMRYNKTPRSLLDWGFGNGDFLRTSKELIGDCYGHDITGCAVPDGCNFEASPLYNSYDVVTFWDVFEHLNDLSIIKEVNANVIVMSMPDVMGKNFDTWKHRKPDEHLHHFSPASLKSYMNAMGWAYLFHNWSEDTIRKGEPRNIFTMAFCRRY
jgi:hypothetical protein